MTSIVQTSAQDIKVLSEIGELSFMESHGHSADPEEIKNFLARYSSVKAFEKELSDSNNIYHIIYHNGRPAGYSKIIFNHPYDGSEINNITKLERIYLVKEFYGLNLGHELLEFLINLSKSNDQKGLWLFVWQENPRAISFYKKNGFDIIGSYMYKLSDTHSNPNFQMFLKY